MAAYQAYVQINNTLDVAMNNVVVVHVWPNGDMSDFFTWPTIAANSLGSPSTTVASSQTGSGYDFWTLIFSLAGDPKVYAMAPTVANLTARDAPPTALQFIVEPENEVAIINPYGPDATGTWADVAILGFLSAGQTFSPTAAVSVQPETAKLSAQA
jgi:hypothetical protein